MRIKINILAMLLAVFCITFFAGCSGGGGNNQDPNAGFRILTYAQIPNGSIVPTGGRVDGNFLNPNGTTTGSVESFDRTHGGVGYLIIQAARVPGTWRLRLGPDFLTGGSQCLTFSTVDRNVSLNSEERLFCPGRFFGFTASPDTIDALNPNATITFSGRGSGNLYGTPIVVFYNEFGNVVASAPASELQHNGTTVEGMVVNVPDLSQVYNGVYTAAIHNTPADGTWELVGAASITVYGNPPPPPPPPPDGGTCGQGTPQQPMLPCEQY